MTKPVRQISTSAKREGKLFVLVDKTGKKLAQFTITTESPVTVNIRDWKAFVKGKGYGKEVLKLYLKKHPDVYWINANGLSKAGEYNIKKALPGWKIVMQGAIGFKYGMATIVRQDVIDQLIESQEKGKRSLFYFNPALHSRNDK